MHTLALWASLVVVLSTTLFFPTITKLRRRSKTNRPDGLYTISEPENVRDADFEIVAVHGLGAHPEYTWTTQPPSRSTNSDDQTRVHLLRDLLKHDFQRARILAFAHNSDWLINGPVTTAQMLADRLLDELLKHRKEHRCIPIVFIAHSFGGIIIKEALCKPGDDAQEVVESTCGIIFLGTPHQGSPMSIIGFLAARITGFLGSNTGLLLSLTRHWEKLSDLDERFAERMTDQARKRHKTEIVAFRETKPTRMLGWLSVGLVVPRDSARGGHAATTIDVDTDHSGLNKCKTREDGLYSKLKQELQRLGATTTPTLNGNQKFVVSQLRTVEGAAFDSHANEHMAMCLEDTRLELLKDIDLWADDHDREHLYWLKGMAGTGKSTIACTVAHRFSHRHRLAASFFFTRNEAERSSARYLFTTIATQFAQRLPKVAAHMRNVIDGDPDISTKALGEQFNRLILRPVEAARETFTKTMIVVIDALDECDRDNDVTAVIELLLQKDLTMGLPLKFLVTSRSEPPILLGFQSAEGKFIEFALHRIPSPIIRQDIATFLAFRLNEIGRQHGFAHNWPDQTKFNDLLMRSTPLFIFAATACRFIEDDRQGGGGPGSRLQKILLQERYGDFHRTYLPSLNQMVHGPKGMSRSRAITEFRQIVGSIATLSNPLSTVSLAKLLDISVGCVKDRLKRLHSVLEIPLDENAPVRLFHQSFREFLFHSEPEDTHEFQVDEKETHKMLAIRCVQLLSESGCLKQNICELEAPGETRFVVGKQTIDRYLPPEVQYATLHWVRHLRDSGVRLYDSHQMLQVLQFLQYHFLHWLEALSLIGKISESIGLIGELQRLLDPHSKTEISQFLRDANRFVIDYRSIIDQAPLQLYASAFVFTPKSSIIRKSFRNYTGQMSAKALVEHDWSACLQTLEGHGGPVRSVAFSADGKWLVYGSDNGTVKILDAASGALQTTLRGHTGTVWSVAFSPDSKRMVSGSEDGTIKIWDTVTGILRSTLNSHSSTVRSVVFSADGRQVVSGSCGGVIKTWDPATGTMQSKLKGPGGMVWSVALSSDDRWVVSGSDDNTVKVWDAATGILQTTLKGHGGIVWSVAFSAEDGWVVSGSEDSNVKIWDAATGLIQSTLRGHSGIVWSVAFSADGRRVASGSGDGTVKIWDAATGIMQTTLKGHGGAVLSVVFSADGEWVASRSSDYTIKIWDAVIGTLQSMLKSHTSTIRSVTFSADGEWVASGSSDKTIKIWDVATGTVHITLRGHASTVRSVALSTDGGWVASGSDDETIKIWDAATGRMKSTLRGHSGTVWSVAFSADGQRVASGSGDGTVKIWDAAKGTIQSTLKGHGGIVWSVVFSTDGRWVASGSWDGTVKIWDVATGTLHSTLVDHNSSVTLDYLLHSMSTSNVYINAVAPKSVKADVSAIGYGISEDSSWITLNGSNWLWLPAEYRHSKSAIRGSTIVLGCKSGTVLILNLKKY